MVKDKLRIKHEVNKSNVTNSFREIWNEIDKRLILEKKSFCGGGGTAGGVQPTSSLYTLDSKKPHTGES